MKTLNSKWDLFNIDLSELPDGDIVINTQEGPINTNKELIEKAKNMAKSFYVEINNEIKNGTKHFKQETEC